MKRKAIIIGAGIGGLATAVRLLGQGYEVEIFEKNKQIGGKINIFQQEGFRFDLTGSILMTPQIYKDVFHNVNRQYEDYLQFIKLDPIYRVNYYDGTRYDFSVEIDKLSNTLESISKEDCQGYFKFLADSYRKYTIAEKYFLNVPFNNIGDFFNPTTLVKALEIKTLSNVYDYVSKYIYDEKLKQFLCFQSMYVGISPFNGPNIYTLIPTVSQIYGLWYLKGGMYSYIKALEKLIYELGGKIHTNAPVEEILIDKGKAVGVKVNDEINKSDIVICNADFSYAMEKLIKDKRTKGKYTDERLSKMKYSCSTFIIYLGLKKKYKELSVHNLYFGEDFKENIEAPFMGKLPKKPSLYIYCPSRIDESMAPKGKECVNVMVRVPNLSFDEIKWDNNTIKSMRYIVFNQLKNIRGLEDIEDNIEYENYLTPVDLHSRFNCYKGAAFSISHTLTQTNYFRPHIKSKTVDELYFVGDSVHPGTGMSIVLLSSKLVSKLIK